jgi:hypothetical protein
MRWIKSSESQPVRGKEYFVRCGEIKGIAIHAGSKWWMTGLKTKYSLMDTDENVEWLEESEELKPDKSFTIAVVENNVDGCVSVSTNNISRVELIGALTIVLQNYTNVRKTNP